MRTEDPEGIAAQLSDVRRRSLQTLGSKLDELERRVDDLLAHRRTRERKRDPLFDVPEALHNAVPAADAPLPPGRRDGCEIPVALAWFPAGEYERASGRWPDLAADWAGGAARRVLPSHRRPHQMDALARRAATSHRLDPR